MPEESPLRKLQDLGQSPWLDFIRRGLIRNGELERMIDEWGLRGMTSNPVIFHRAITQTDEYDADIVRLAKQGGSAEEIYERLVTDDVRAAADVFRPVYERTDGADGFVSLEVSPHLALDAELTIAEAERLWHELDRPNVMIKVPGTEEGLRAVRRLLADGINVNVTLLFSVARYRQVLDAHVAGLESARSRNGRLDRIASVASFFLSRIDAKVDPMLDRIATGDGARARSAASLRGRIAIASARSAYRAFTELAATERFEGLAASGARAQRPLWASTGTKDPAYSDVKYVEALIVPGTVNTMPLETLEAYHDHGRPAVRLVPGAGESEPELDALEALGIDLAEVTDRLLDEGIRKFIEPYDRLLQALEARCRALS